MGLPERHDLELVAERHLLFQPFLAMLGAMPVSEAKRKQLAERMEKLGFARESDNRDKDNYNEAKNKITASLKDYFRPEFLNRIDDTIIFDILSPEAIREIVKIQVDQVVKRLHDKQINLVFSAPVFDYLAKEGYNPQYGARPLKRLIQNKVLTPVANLLIGQEVAKGGTIEVGVKPLAKNSVAGAPVEFTFEVKKKHKGESPVVMPKMVGQK